MNAFCPGFIDSGAKIDESSAGFDDFLLTFIDSPAECDDSAGRIIESSGEDDHPSLNFH